MRRLGLETETFKENTIHDKIKDSFEALGKELR